MNQIPAVHPEAFVGKNAIVTGAASGFGTAIAEQIAAAGGRVVVADINGDGAKAVADRLPGAIAVTVDLGDPASIRNLIDTTVAELGQIDVLCNNAGVPHRIGHVFDFDIDTFEQQMNINVRSIFLAAKYAYPHMPDGSVIVNTTSVSAIRPRPGRALYNTSKGAAHTLTLCLASELAPRIRVNSVQPVASSTGFITAATGKSEMTPELEASVISGIPMGRQAEPADIGAAVAFLASPAARFLTGVCLPVDGGRSIQ